MLEYKIMNAIRDNGPTRGSNEEFGQAFDCSAKEAAEALQAMVRRGILLKAAPLPVTGARPVYSYNHPEFGMATPERRHQVPGNRAMMEARSKI